MTFGVYAPADLLTLEFNLQVMDSFLQLDFLLEVQVLTVKVLMEFNDLNFIRAHITFEDPAWQDV